MTSETAVYTISENHRSQAGQKECFGARGRQLGQEGNHVAQVINLSGNYCHYRYRRLLRRRPQAAVQQPARLRYRPIPNRLAPSQSRRAAEHRADPDRLAIPEAGAKIPHSRWCHSKRRQESCLANERWSRPSVPIPLSLTHLTQSRHTIANH